VILLHEHFAFSLLQAVVSALKKPNSTIVCLRHLCDLLALPLSFQVQFYVNQGDFHGSF
jgi:hypothetical protein